MQHVPLGRHGRQQRRRRRPQIGAQRERVHPLYGDEPHAHQRRQRGGEHGRGLHEEGEDGAGHQREVASQPGDVGDVGVQGLLDQLGYGACKIKKIIENSNFTLEQSKADSICLK